MSRMASSVEKPVCFTNCYILCVILPVIVVSTAGVRKVYAPEANIDRRQLSAWCIAPSLISGRAVTLGLAGEGGKSLVSKTIGLIAYSESLKKIFTSTEEVPAPGRETINKYFDFPGRTLYTVINNTTCIKTPLPGPFRPLCVPDNSTMTLIKSFFGVSDHVQFVLEFTGTVDEVRYRVSLTRSTFVPVFLDIWGARYDRRFFETQTFYNTSLHDIPSDVFHPPPVCEEVHMTNQAARENFLETELRWPFV